MKNIIQYSKNIIMPTLRPLLDNKQTIRIDNHHRNLPIKWDWDENEIAQDVHMDKSRRVNGKNITIKVTLNQDNAADGINKKERNDKSWMNAYEEMKDEVKKTLSECPDVRKQLAEDLADSIREIGPNKEERAIRKAIERVGRAFGLGEDAIVDMKSS